MNTKKRGLFLLTALCMVLTACTALTLRDANNRLEDLYAAKREARDDQQLDKEKSVNADLVALARGAAEQAERESKPVNRIAFYRVAATATWQAGDARVNEYTQRGQDLCKGGNFDKAPRDCGMLMVITSMASVDELTVKFKKAKESPDTDLEEAVELFNGFKFNLVNILNQRDTIKESSADPVLLDEIDRRAGRILCVHMQANALGFIGKLEGPRRDDDSRQPKCDLYHLKKKFKDLGFTADTAACLPPGEPRKPTRCS